MSVAAATRKATVYGTRPRVLTTTAGDLQFKQWRGIAMRSDKTARNYHSALYLAATLHWLDTFSNTP